MDMHIGMPITTIEDFVKVQVLGQVVVQVLVQVQVEIEVRFSF